MNPLSTSNATCENVNFMFKDFNIVLNGSCINKPPKLRGSHKGTWHVHCGYGGRGDQSGGRLFLYGQRGHGIP